MAVSGRRNSVVIFVMCTMVLIVNSSNCSVEYSQFRNISWNLNCTTLSKSSPRRITLEKFKNRVVMDNGIIQVTISNPYGNVEKLKFNGIDNVLDSRNQKSKRGYWDVYWNNPGKETKIDRLKCTDFRVIVEEENKVEISFTSTWNVSGKRSKHRAPVNIDKRFIMLQGQSGYYAYTIFERLKGWPDANMDQIRTVYKLEGKRFNFMSISDNKQRVMPSKADRAKGKKLAYPEAVYLTNPSDPKLKGEVDDKYQYTQEKSTKVHGWICFDPPVGFWMVTPSDEFRNGGPTKQDLTSHVGPTTLSMFGSTHYAGNDLRMEFRNGEPWKKVFGPIFVYLNAAPPRSRPCVLWEDAKRLASEEIKSWPYNFVTSGDYPRSDQRGGVDGQLLVSDRYMNKKLMWASSAYVGLAAPGEIGSWQKESKGYQFWTQADTQGRFSINNVRPGDYDLYAWVPRFVGDYKYKVTITIRPGERIKLPNLVYIPPRNGPTLWEIGVPDRSAVEFYVPDPYPNRVNRLYINQPLDKYRQYGLWERYADLYPKNDLVFKIGVNNYARDWFFAHVTRKTRNKEFKPTTWQIIFELENVQKNKNYTLQLALASASESNLHVRINDPNAKKPIFMTGVIGKDNAIARHGIHGLYRFYSANVESSKLVNGKNTILLTQVRSNGPFQGHMAGRPPPPHGPWILDSRPISLQHGPSSFSWAFSSSPCLKRACTDGLKYHFNPYQAQAQLQESSYP